MKREAAKDASFMLKQLKAKFIALNMGIAALVLIVTFTTICVFSHHQSEDAIYSALNGSIGRISEAEEAFVPHNPKEQNKIQLSPPEIGGVFPGQKNIEHIPIALFLVDNIQTVQLSNKSNASIAEDVLALAIPDALSSAEVQGYLRGSNLFFAKRKVGDEILIAFADGSSANDWIPLAWTLTLIGVIALAVLFVINIFFSRWALRPIEIAWKKQQQFVADASHELKTPLTVILANNTILRSNSKETIENQAQWIESTQEEAERMSSLIEAMLDSARLVESPNKSPKEFETLDLSRLVNKELLQFESLAFEHNLTLASGIENEIFISGDKQDLQKLIGIILDNACKYSDEGGTIKLNLQSKNMFAYLTICNSGQVINDADIPYLFDRFYRTDKSRSHPEKGGYGLGLSIAKGIVDKLDATISVTSTKQNGTEFCVKIPLAKNKTAHQK